MPQAAKEPPPLTLDQWQAQNRAALRPALDYIYATFINVPPGLLPWDTDGSTRRAAQDAIRAIDWLLKPVETEVIKTYKEPYQRVSE